MNCSITPYNENFFFLFRQQKFAGVVSRLQNWLRKLRHRWEIFMNWHNLLWKINLIGCRRMWWLFWTYNREWAWNWNSNVDVIRELWNEVLLFINKIAKRFRRKFKWHQSVFPSQLLIKLHVCVKTVVNRFVKPQVSGSFPRSIFFADLDACEVDVVFIADLFNPMKLDLKIRWNLRRNVWSIDSQCSAWMYWPWCRFGPKKQKLKLFWWKCSEPWWIETELAVGCGSI